MPEAFDLEDHVARAGCRIGEPSELQLAISEKHDAFHGPPPVRGVRRARMTRRSSVLSEASRLLEWRYGESRKAFLGISGLRGTNPRLSVDGGALRNSGAQ